MKKEEQREIVDLGYANGWGETPEIVKKCWEQDHEREGGNIGRCLSETICRICGYKYKIDSSD
jgi:hypothetical protein